MLPTGGAATNKSLLRFSWATIKYFQSGVNLRRKTFYIINLCKINVCFLNMFILPPPPPPPPRAKEQAPTCWSFFFLPPKVIFLALLVDTLFAAHFLDHNKLNSFFKCSARPHNNLNNKTNFTGFTLYTKLLSRPIEWFIYSINIEFLVCLYYSRCQKYSCEQETQISTLLSSYSSRRINNEEMEIK